jgi:hypothetical protein
MRPMLGWAAPKTAQGPKALRAEELERPMTIGAVLYPIWSKGDICSAKRDVRLVPKADTRQMAHVRQVPLEIISRR